jgi:hypothetical protein
MTAPGDEAAQTTVQRRDLALVKEQALALKDGEAAPLVLTVDTAKGAHINFPLGAYVLRDGKPCFMPTIDLDGLTAITLGIGLGWFTIHRFSPIFRALAERIRKG